jgi:hypothetical protein
MEHEPAFLKSGVWGTTARKRRFSMLELRRDGAMIDDATTTDHGFIRAWAEAREGKPGRLDGRIPPLLRFDFGTPEPGLTEIAWDEFFDIFEHEQLALEYRETQGHLGRLYKFVPRQAPR